MPLRDSTTCHPQRYCPPQSCLVTPSESSIHRAVFLDRDGTIVKDVGYLTKLSQLELLPGAADAIRLLQEHFLIVIVTNQSAVARGLLDEKGLLLIHQELAKTLYNLGASLDAIYACPHHPAVGSFPCSVNCHCRKPEPGMLLAASDDFNIQLDSSFMIGDRGLDIIAGQRAGVTATILVKSHKTSLPLTSEIIPTYVADNLYDAAKLIMNHQAKGS